MHTAITYHQQVVPADEPLIVERDRAHRVQVLYAAPVRPEGPIFYRYLVIADAVSSWTEG